MIFGHRREFGIEHRKPIDLRAGRENGAFDSKRVTSIEHIEMPGHIVGIGSRIGHDAGVRPRRHMHHRIGPGVGERAVNVLRLGDIALHIAHPGDPFGRGSKVETGDLMAGPGQFGNYKFADPSRASGYNDPHRPSFSSTQPGHALGSAPKLVILVLVVLIERCKMKTDAPPSLSAQTAGRLRAWIAANGLKSGARLPPEHELMVQLDVSRTVLREAVAGLRAQGELTSRRGSGVFVARMADDGHIQIEQAEDEATPTAILNLL